MGEAAPEDWARRYSVGGNGEAPGRDLKTKGNIMTVTLRKNCLVRGQHHQAGETVDVPLADAQRLLAAGRIETPRDSTGFRTTKVAKGGVRPGGYKWVGEPYYPA